jgi:hypothetical protein
MLVALKAHLVGAVQGALPVAKVLKGGAVHLGLVGSQ